MESAAAGRLVIAGAPIGDVDHASPRLRRILTETDVIAAEDTRRTGLLLRHFGIARPLLSYHAHNRQARLPRLLEALAVGDVALVTDAGTPVVSDPGEDLVAAAAGQGFEVIAVPGPSAAVAAVSVSGLPAAPFHVIGFLPRRAPERRRPAASPESSCWPSRTSPSTPGPSSRRRRSTSTSATSAPTTRRGPSG